MAYIGRRPLNTLLYGGGDDPVEGLAPGTAGQILSTGVDGGPPVWIDGRQGLLHRRHAQTLTETGPTGSPVPLDRTAAFNYYAITTAAGRPGGNDWTAKGRLPAARGTLSEGSTITIKWISHTGSTLSPGNDLTIFPAVSGLLDGQPSFPFDGVGQAFTFVYTGSGDNWEVL